MRINYFSITFVALIILLQTVSAQKTLQTNESSLKFKSGFFIGGNAGINWYLAEGNDFLFEKANKLYFLKNIGTQGVLNVGYHFNPVYALRSGFEFDNYNYAAEFFGVEITTPIKSQKLNFDLLVNLTNLKKGYDPDRKITLSAFGGLGAAFYNNNKVAKKIGGVLRGGIQGDYHFTPQLALNVIADANILTDNSNDDVLELPFDMTGGVSVGLSYRFVENKKQSKIVPVIVPETTPVPKTIEPEIVTPKIVEPEKPKVVVVDTPKVVVPEVKPVVKPEPIVEIPKMIENIFFKFNTIEIDQENQEANIYRYAEYLKKYANIKVVVNGYADNASGTDEINSEISKYRAIHIAKKLIKTYGIDSNRIMVKWHGCKNQPFNEIWKNRVVILNTAEGDDLINFKSFEQ